MLLFGHCVISGIQHVRFYGLLLLHTKFAKDPFTLVPLFIWNQFQNMHKLIENRWGWKHTSHHSPWGESWCIQHSHWNPTQCKGTRSNWWWSLVYKIEWHLHTTHSVEKNSQEYNLARLTILERLFMSIFTIVAFMPLMSLHVVRIVSMHDVN